MFLLYAAHHLPLCLKAGPFRLIIRLASSLFLLSVFVEKPREACFDPGNIMNGSRLGMDYKLGSVVTYECDSGYTTMGPATLTCIIGSDGKPIWDKPLPTCKGKTTMV